MWIIIKVILESPGFFLVPYAASSRCHPAPAFNPTSPALPRAPAYFAFHLLSYIFSNKTYSLSKSSSSSNGDPANSSQSECLDIFLSFPRSLLLRVPVINVTCRPDAAFIKYYIYCLLITQKLLWVSV